MYNTYMLRKLENRENLILRQKNTLNLLNFVTHFLDPLTLAIIFSKYFSSWRPSLKSLFKLDETRPGNLVDASHLPETSSGRQKGQTDGRKYLRTTALVGLMLARVANIVKQLWVTFTLGFYILELCTISFGNPFGYYHMLKTLFKEPKNTMM